MLILASTSPLLIAPDSPLVNDSSLLVIERRPKFCKSCAAVENELTKVAAEFNDKITVFNADSDDESSFEDKPTFTFIRNGEKVGSYSGFDGEMLRIKITEIL